MVERALRARVETTLAEYERAEDWDVPLLQQDLLMHYLLSVPEFDTPERRPTDGAGRGAGGDRRGADGVRRQVREPQPDPGRPGGRTPTACCRW